MRRFISALLAISICFLYSMPVSIAAEMVQPKALQLSPNAKPIELAFVFDGPSDKNEVVLQKFQKTITRSLMPDYKAVFPKDLIFTGD